MQEGFTIKFTPQASYELEPKTATPTGVIQLDGLVERLFSEYLILVDPVTNLGLAAESVKSYTIGDLER